MANPLAIRAYYGVTSANITTKTTLADILVAAYAARTPSETIFCPAAAEVLIYAMDDNGKLLLIGDAKLTTTDFAYTLAGGSSRRYGPYEKSAVPIGDIYVMSEDGATAITIGLEVIPV